MFLAVMGFGTMSTANINATETDVVSKLNEPQKKNRYIEKDLDVKNELKNITINKKEEI